LQPRFSASRRVYLAGTLCEVDLLDKYHRHKTGGSLKAVGLREPSYEVDTGDEGI